MGPTARAGSPVEALPTRTEDTVLANSAGPMVSPVCAAYEANAIGASSSITRNYTTRFQGLNSPAYTIAEQPDTPDALEFSDLELDCPINAGDIRNRWLSSFVGVPGQKPKEFPPRVTAFISRILKSYVATIIRGRGLPPFVHASQTTVEGARPPLSTCLGLVRMCQNPLPDSETAAVDILIREMASLHEQLGAHDDLTLLSAFQAYLIYCLVLFFQLQSGSKRFLREAMMNLQELACASSRQGLVCRAEAQLTRPKWEAWIVVEAKRRTLYTMYLFDSLLLTEDRLPTFLGTELRGLPSSASRDLWKANKRCAWETEYSAWLAYWGGGGLRIDELWPMDPSLDEKTVMGTRERVDRWLEDVDEFGTMMYAVTSCTHGT